MGKAVIACTRGGVHAINRKWIYSATTSADDGDGTDLFSRKAFRMFLAAPKFVSAPDKIYPSQIIVWFLVAFTLGRYPGETIDY